LAQVLLGAPAATAALLFNGTKQCSDGDLVPSNCVLRAKWAGLAGGKGGCVAAWCGVVRGVWCVFFLECLYLCDVRVNTRV
jgi:hypothetical protein